MRITNEKDWQQASEDTVDEISKEEKLHVDEGWEKDKIIKAWKLFISDTWTPCEETDC